jgi:molybdate/tungstate transport system substrate-binding protein
LRTLISCAIAIILIGSPGCDSKPAKTQLRVFIADSLLRSFNAVTETFQKDNPDVEVVLVASGSVLAARRITQANDQADVLAVADYTVIDRLMRPQFADWSICFATNEIGIIYTDASKGAAELTADNWFDVLSREGATVAAANPLHDPCGYWTEFCWKLADLHYPAASGGSTISQRMTGKCGPAADRRSDSEQILQLVESAGGLDYAFVYRSQAMQHHLPFLRLPPEINLGDPARVDSYRRVSIDLPGKGPDQTSRKGGDAVVYAITIPKVARQSELAARYISFILSPAGKAILEKEYIQVVQQPWTADLDRVPASLRSGLSTRPRSPTTTNSAGDGHGR